MAKIIAGSGVLVDPNSWELTIFVTDLQTEHTLRVYGDLHMGGVMLKLVEAMDIAMDWSDHALFWAERNTWLSRTRSTLDQYGVQADARLVFTPMHKKCRVQLPDLQVLECRIDFSCQVFKAVVHLCKDLGIRHPEELSFLKKVNFHQNAPPSSAVGKSKGGKGTPKHDASFDFTVDGSASPFNSPRTPQHIPRSPHLSASMRPPGTPSTPGSNPNSPYTPVFLSGQTTPRTPNESMNGSFARLGDGSTSLSHSPATPTKDAFASVQKPRNVIDRARFNSGWLNSSKSLMEQGITEEDILLLRYKFVSFYDLNPKYDPVRINQIYEQAKWSLLSEEIDCTEEEGIMFAALQLQIQLHGSVQSNLLDGTSNADDDDIDAALNNLQVSLEGSALSNTSDITSIPELSDNLKYMKPKKFGLKSYKKAFFIFKDLFLTAFKSAEETNTNPVFRANLRGCEVTPDVTISQNKYHIKLFVPGSEGGDALEEIVVKCDTELQYAQWMAAFRLASKGKTMADATYESEVQSIKTFLSMQHPATGASTSFGSGGSGNVDSHLLNEIRPEDCIPYKQLKKQKPKAISTRISEAHANVCHLAALEAKIKYIQAWQTLPEFGITPFVVRFTSPASKKDELLGIAPNRIMQMDLHTGETIKTVRFSTMKSWSVNWEVKEVQIDREDGCIKFQCLSSDPKVVHEFIGGYIFLSMRSKEQNETLNEELFHRLTGGWA